MRYSNIALSGIAIALATSCAITPSAHLRSLPRAFSIESARKYPPAPKHSFLPTEAPSSYVIDLKTARPLPALEKGPRYFFPSKSYIAIFNITDLTKKKYPWLYKQTTLLKTILQSKPNEEQLAQWYNEYNYPSFPYNNAAQAFHAKTRYLSTDWGECIGYITQFTQDGGTPANNEELCYYVQGLTYDNRHYISASFSLRHPKLPAGIDSTERRPKGEYGKDQRLLDSQPDNSFVPALSDILTAISSLQIK